MSTTYFDVNRFAYKASFASAPAPDGEVLVTLLDPETSSPLPRWAVYGKNCSEPDEDTYLICDTPSDRLLSVLASHCSNFVCDAQLLPYLDQRPFPNADGKAFLSISRNSLDVWVSEEPEDKAVLRITAADIIDGFIPWMKKHHPDVDLTKSSLPPLACPEGWSVVE